MGALRACKERGLYILEDRGVTASVPDALQLSIGQLLDVAVHRVVNDCNLGRHLEGFGVSKNGIRIDVGKL
jgi:hypothetical protein